MTLCSVDVPWLRTCPRVDDAFVKRVWACCFASRRVVREVSAPLRIAFRNRPAALSTSFSASLAIASSRGPAGWAFLAAELRDLARPLAGFLGVVFFLVVAIK